MTVLSKHNYEEDDGRIMKAARKQQYIMFPAPISFLDDELKAELGMKAKMKNSCVLVLLHMIGFGVPSSCLQCISAGMVVLVW
jgi:hypothetical protein